MLIKISTIQSKVTRHTKKKKENVIQSEGKKQSIETESKMAQILGLADKYFQAAIMCIFFKGK